MRGEEGGERREERKEKTFKAMLLFLVHISSTYVHPAETHVKTCTVEWSTRRCPAATLWVCTHQSLNRVQCL